MIAQSETVLLAFTDMLKAVTETSLKESEKLKILNDYFKTTNSANGVDLNVNKPTGAGLRANASWLESYEFR